MMQRFVNDKTLASAQRFEEIAADIGMSVVTMAVAWSKQHDFVASTIVGATSEGQVAELLAAADVVLDVETLGRIDSVSRDIPYPMG